MKPAVVIPAYNEAATIAGIARRARAVVDQVIVVDDGSTDATAAQLDELDVTLLRNSHNRGKAASIWHGAIHAIEQGADVVITLDGDGQHSPEDIPRLLEEYVANPGCIVIGARVLGRENAPWLRAFSNRQADFWISWAAGYPIRDTQSGFRAYPDSVFREVMAPHDVAHGFVFESDILIQAARSGIYSRGVPIDTVYHKHEGARSSHYHPVYDSLRIIRQVGWRLISRGMYPLGLLRALGVLPLPR
ncbi:MAG: glycosyltransferase family 2 protein [Gammaproteobacteria bacterium]